MKVMPIPCINIVYRWICLKNVLIYQKYYFFFKLMVPCIVIQCEKKNPTDATVWRYLFTAKLLYMFRVSQHPSSGVPIRPHWRGIAEQIV